MHEASDSIFTFCVFFSLTKPQSFADCVGDELPVGWEQVLDYNRGVYYVNHVESKLNTLANPINSVLTIPFQNKFKLKIHALNGEPFRRICCGSIWLLQKKIFKPKRSL